MKSANPDDDSFEILSDNGQPLGAAFVFDRKRVVVNVVEPYRDSDPLHANIEPVREFAEAEARRLKLVDE